MNGDDIDQRLENLAHRTAGVRPRADFGARVLRAIEQTEAADASGAFATRTWLLGRRVLPVAALAACAALVLAMKSADRYEDVLVSTVDDSGVELGW